MNSRLTRLLYDKRVRRTALLLALWVPAVAVLLAVREILLPFVLALLLAYVIAPVVRRLSSIQLRGRRLSPWVSVIVIYAAFAGILWVVGSIFVPQLYREGVRLAKDGTELVNNLDDATIAGFGNQLEEWFNRYNVPVTIVTPGENSADATGALTLDVVQVTKDIIKDAKASVFDESRRVLSEIRTVVGTTLRVLFTTFLVLMLTGFIAADTKRIFDFLFSITPVRDRSMLQDLIVRIDRGLSGVVRGQLTICAINGVLTLVGLLLLRVKFAFLLATLAAVFSLVPIFGSILSTIPIVIVALSGGLSTALLAVGWIVGVHILEANFLNPKIMGDAAKIHPALIMLALLIGEHFYGLVGALLAVPIMSIVVTIFRSAQQKAMELDAQVRPAEDFENSGASARRRVRMTDGG